MTVAGVAGADPRNGVDMTATCDNGFQGTLVAVPWSGEPASLTVADGTSVFVVHRLYVRDDETVYHDYGKPGKRKGQTPTTCAISVAEFGVYGTLTGVFSPPK